MSAEPQASQLHELEIQFEADSDAEEELADDELINPELITDREIGQCRVVASVECVEYGQVEGQPGALLVFTFNFHNFKTHFRNARICATFQKLDGPNITTVRHLAPVCLIIDLSEANVTRSIQGGLSLGWSSFGVNATASCQTESTRKHRLHIHSSGGSTSRAVWTLEEENVTGNRNGIPGQFTAAMLVQTRADFTISISIAAKIGLFGDIQDSVIRRIKNRGRIPKLRFEGKKELGRRPPGLVIAESVFVKAPGPSI